MNCILGSLAFAQTERWKPQAKLSDPVETLELSLKPSGVEIAKEVDLNTNAVEVVVGSPDRRMEALIELPMGLADLDI